jgi:hypothetical protein
MADFSLIRTIEFVLCMALLMSALYACTIWHEPACGIILFYSAIRLVLRGI